MNYVDLFLGFILFHGIYKGFRRGLVLTLGGAFGWVISLAIAAIYSGSFRGLIDKNFQMTIKTGEWLTEKLPLADVAQSVGTNANGLQGIIDNLTLPDFMKESLLGEMLKVNAAGVNPDSATYVLGYGLAALVVKLISFLIVFFIASFLLRALLRFLNKGLNMTFLGGVNRLSGGIAGLLINGGVLAIIIGSLYPFLTFLNTTSPIIMQIKSSFLIPPLVKIFDAFGNRFIF